jgi:hypothetical protein
LLDRIGPVIKAQFELIIQRAGNEQQARFQSASQSDPEYEQLEEVLLAHAMLNRVHRLIGRTDGLISKFGPDYLAQ